MTDTPHFKRTELSVAGRVAVLTLASDKVNALDREVLDEIVAFVDFCEDDAGVGALVLTGQGSVFSAGLNVSEILANEKGYVDELLDAFGAVLLRLFRCPLPTVAAINGSAIAGGCLVACTCDRRLIAEEARIGVTELRVGVSFPVGAVDLLRYACGSRAEQLILNADLLDAEAACLCGLAHQRLPPSELLDAATTVAEQLASLDARAYALAKATVRRGAMATPDDEVAGELEGQVRAHWQEDSTRASLERLLKPK